MVEIGGGDASVYAEPVSGRSLGALMRGELDPVDEAVAEYCAEMTPYPVFMIRRGSLKYIHCDPDPPQLYDLAQDPGELTNLASDPEYAHAAAAFAEEVAARWDSEAIRGRVMASQASRLKLNDAMAAGAGEDWDYNPPSDASQQYVRNHMDWTVAAARYRSPPQEE